MSAAEGDHAALAIAWVEHLREGGTTPWRSWVRDAGPAPAPPGAGPPTTAGPAGIPGAAQLELLRRLNLVGPVPHLADHVLGRPGPGRGPLHLRLPTNPEDKVAPRREVLRVATGVLADLTAQLPVARTRRRRRGSRPAAGTPSFVLDGLPLTVAETRVRLAAAGVSEHRARFSWFGGRPDPGPDQVVVLAGPLDEALRQAWCARVQRGAGRAWPRFVAHWAGRHSLPASAALDRTVDYWAGLLGAGNVHLVPLTGAGDPDPVARVLEVLGLPPLPSGGTPAAPVPPGDPVWLPPALVDVLRRVNVVLPFVCPEADRAPRRTALVQLMRDETGRPEPADLPEAHRAWAESAAARLVEELEESGSVAHGDLAALRSVAPAAGRRVGDAEVLDAIVRMIHRVDAALVGGRRNGRGGR